MNALLSQLLDLDVSEKLELVEALWDSVAATPNVVPIPAWQKEELAARKVASQESPNNGAPWDEAQSSARPSFTSGFRSGRVTLR